MFGRHQQRPEPPDREPLILVLLAVAIATVLTISYGFIMYLIERLDGMP